MALRKMATSFILILLRARQREKRMVKSDDATEQWIAKVAGPTRGFVDVTGGAGELATQSTGGSKTSETDGCGAGVTNPP